MKNYSNYYSDDIEIDVLDLCKVLLSKWKWLICGLLCGLIVALGFTAFKPSPAVLSVEKQENRLLENLSETDRNYVEDLYQSYYVMNRRIDLLRTKLYSSQIDSLELNEYDRLMKRTYFAVNSPINRLSYVISETALAPEDYIELSNILYGDKDHAAEASQRVLLRCITDNERLDPVQYISRDSEPESSYEVLILTIISDSTSKVDEASNYVQQQLTNKKYSIGNNETDITIAEIDHQYSEDQKMIVQALYSTFESNSNSLYNAEVALNNLQTNYISKLTGDSKTYYSLLNKEDISTTVSPKKYKRNGLLGALLGLFAACAWFALRYIFDGTIKTVSDLCWLLKGDMPYELNEADKGDNKEPSSVLAAEDIAIRLNQNNKKSLFIVAGEKTKDLDLVQETISAIKEKFSGNIKIGDPCTSAADMRELSESDAVVMVVPLKQESRKKVEQTEQICRGYNTEIIGVITL